VVTGAPEPSGTPDSTGAPGTRADAVGAGELGGTGVTTVWAAPEAAVGGTAVALVSAVPDKGAVPDKADDDGGSTCGLVCGMVGVLTVGHTGSI